MRIAELLRRLEQGTDAAMFERLAEIYTSAETTEQERKAIQTAVSGTRALMFGIEAWAREISDEDPARYVRLRAATISMSDGWPDSRDAFLTAKHLLEFAEAHGEACLGELERIVRLSTARVRHLFESPTLNMHLWSSS